MTTKLMSIFQTFVPQYIFHAISPKLVITLYTRYINNECPKALDSKKHSNVSIDQSDSIWN